MRIVGRDSEIEAIVTHFAAGDRLVVLTGTAGVGKTTLLRAVAEDEGADVVSLRGVASRRDLASRLADAFGLSTSASDDDLLHVAATRPGHVLALDDAEDLAEDALALLAGMHETASTLRIVAASRRALRLEGERVVRVEPLDDAAATALMIELAKRASSAFAPNEAELADVTRLTGALGGLPLAIERAARRLPLVGAAALLEDVARHGAMHGPALERAIDAEIAMLSPNARLALDRASVLVGAFDLSMFDVLAEGSGVAAIEALFDGSLLRVDTVGERRHYALYDSAREAAVRGLRQRGEEVAIVDDVTERIVEHALALGERARAGARDAAESLFVLARDLESASRRELARRPLLSARAAFALEPILGVVHGYVALLDEVVAARPPAPALARVLVARGRAQLAAGSIERGVADMDLALEHVADDPFIEGLAATKAAIGRVLMGTPVGTLFERAERAVALAGDAWLAAVFRRDRAVALLREGRDAEAQQSLEDILASRRGFGGEIPALVFATLAQIHQARGELEPAAARFEEAVTTARAWRQRPLLAWALTVLASVEIEMGKHDDARHHLDESLRIATEVQGGGLEAVALATLAQLTHETGDLARAVVAYHRAVPALVRVKQQRGAMLATAACAAAEAALGHADLARERLGEARARLTAPRPGDAEALDAFAAVVSLEAARRGDGELAVAQREAAAARARAKAALSSDELRMAVRLLDASLAMSRPPPPPAPAVALHIGAGGAWFETAAGRAHLPERSPLRRVLSVFARARIEHPGRATSMTDVFRFAWPDERAIPRAVANRVKVAVNTLRKAGLKDVLETTPDGYRFSPEVDVVIEADR